MTQLKKVEWIPEMGEISGMGEGYEAQCRRMLDAAIDWHNQNPDKDPSVSTLKNVYGLTKNENEAAEELEKYILDNIPGNDCTGAMMQAVLGHYFFIRNNGVEKHREELVNYRKKEQQ